MQELNTYAHPHLSQQVRTSEEFNIELHSARSDAAAPKYGSGKHAPQPSDSKKIQTINAQPKSTSSSTSPIPIKRRKMTSGPAPSSNSPEIASKPSNSPSQTDLSDPNTVTAFIKERSPPAQSSGRSWRLPYTAHDVSLCIRKITSVSFNQKVYPIANGSIYVMPVSSGFSIGSCNWVVQSTSEKIVYVSSSCTPTLQRHPLPLDQNALAKADVMIMSSLSLAKQPVEQVVHALRGHVENTLRNQGNVLLPVLSSGLIFDLLEVLFLHLKKKGMGNVRVFFISPTAKKSLAYSSITGEYLCDQKQELVNQGRNPFVHNDLVRERLLCPLESVTEFVALPSESAASGTRLHQLRIAATTIFDVTSPCIVLAGHPSLHFGPVIEFMRRWGPDPRNTMILTEPAFCNVEQVERDARKIFGAMEGASDQMDITEHQTLKMRVLSCPIDPQLTLARASQIIEAAKPKTLIIEEKYLEMDFKEKISALTEEKIGCPIQTFSHLRLLDLPLASEFQMGHLSSSLAKSILPVPVGSPTRGRAAAHIRAILCQRDDQYTLESLPSDLHTISRQSNQQLQLSSERLFWGNIVPKDVIKTFGSYGVHDIRIFTPNQVHIPSLGPHLPDAGAIAVPTA